LRGNFFLADNRFESSFNVTKNNPSVKTLFPLDFKLNYQEHSSAGKKIFDELKTTFYDSFFITVIYCSNVFKRLCTL
jgi:hypothetical protein